MARASRSEWTKRITEWRESGLSGAEFAQRIGVKEATLRHWKWQLARSHRSAGRRGRPTSPTFVEISATRDSGAPEPFELELASGIRLRVPQRFDADALGRLFAALGAR